jgi:hypothetical protein
VSLIGLRRPLIEPQTQTPVEDGGGNDTYTELLMHFDDDYIDSSKNNFIVTKTTTAWYIGISGSAYAAFGKCCYVNILNSNYTYSYLYINDCNALQLGSVWTIDFWFYPLAIGSGYISNIIGKGYKNSDAVGNFRLFRIPNLNGSSTMYFQYLDGTVERCSLICPSIPDNICSHIAIVSTGSEIFMFINGQVIDSKIATVDIQAIGKGFCIGASGNAIPSTERFGGSAHGYIDEFRISKGVARWTHNFTPKTEAYV